MGIGDWGLGIGPNPQSPIPNPQSPSQLRIFLFLSYNVHKGTNNAFDIYLKNLPEDFDLLITLDVYNKYNNNSEKVLLVRKNFEYPDYRIDESNPNKTMIIISITFICIAFILTLIFVLLKIIFGFF